MTTTSFLPDKMPVISSVLVHLPYKRSDLEKVADPGEPSIFPLVKTSAISTWALLYIAETEIGVYIHPPRAPMGGLFNTSTGDELPRAIHIRIPYGQLAKAEIIHPSPPASFMERIYQWFTIQEENRCRITWKDNCMLEAFITSDNPEFEAKLREYTGK